MIRYLKEKQCKTRLATNRKKSSSDEMGSIHFSQLSEQFDETIEEVISIGDTCSARVLGYDDMHDKWKLTLRNL